MNYYQLMFSLGNHHGWNTETIERLIPFERDVYVDLLNAYLERLKEERNKHGG